MFDRTVNAKGMKTKVSQETVKAFSSMITKKNRPKKIWVDKGTEFAEAFKKFCAAEGIQFYSTMSETKAAFAERTIRSSLKNVLYCYMENFGYKYIHTLRQFITALNSRLNNSIDMRPNAVKNCDFMSILYSEHLREYKKPTFKMLECESHFMTCLFRIGYKPQFTRQVFEIVAIATRKPPTYTIKDEQGEIIQGKFYQKELNKVI